MVVYSFSIIFECKLTILFPEGAGYSQNTGAIGTDKSNPWMEQNWVGTEPVNLPFELVQWICGYTDAECSFLVTHGREKLTGKPRPLRGRPLRGGGALLKYQLRVHIDHLPLLEWLKDNVFGSGHISNEAGRIATYHISDFRTINGVVIPLFNQFTLNTKKWLYFKAAASREEIAQIMAMKEHLTPEGSQKIYEIRRSMKNFRTNYDLPSTHIFNITNYWLLGFVEGSFYYDTTPRFSISQEDVSLPTLHAIPGGTPFSFFFLIHTQNQKPPKGGNGSVYRAGSGEQTDHMNKFLISDMQVLYDEIVPLFNSLHFFTTKGVDYQYWQYLVQLHRGSYHLTTAGQEMIKRLVSNMNQRHLSTQIILTGITPDPVLISSIQPRRAF
ncbi:hypothetical protein BC937DRAFT_88878 [Endogone sp. FLAS-F59071]|nr:hypothetical protein BC937DRAFT_88878 [Endogone sp. FLAS-F59071]|eukprot:RUS23411.1 hypothetical protein BC937DRAFT_88878 [Endogone sp. FLAS-F59071]